MVRKHIASRVGQLIDPLTQAIAGRTDPPVRHARPNRGLSHDAKHLAVDARLFALKASQQLLLSRCRAHRRHGSGLFSAAT